MEIVVLFEFFNEGYIFGNVFRYVIMRKWVEFLSWILWNFININCSFEVEFCVYVIFYLLEVKMNVRI